MIVIDWKRGWFELEERQSILLQICILKLHNREHFLCQINRFFRQTHFFLVWQTSTDVNVITVMNVPHMATKVIEWMANPRNMNELVVAKSSVDYLTFSCECCDLKLNPQHFNFNCFRELSWERMFRVRWIKSLAFACGMWTVWCHRWFLTKEIKNKLERSSFDKSLEGRTCFEVTEPRTGCEFGAKTNTELPNVTKKNSLRFLHWFIRSVWDPLKASRVSSWPTSLCGMFPGLVESESYGNSSAIIAKINI